MKERRGNGKEQLRLGESVKKTTVGAEGKPVTEKERECAEGKRREGGEKKVCEGGREGGRVRTGLVHGADVQRVAHFSQSLTGNSTSLGLHVGI